MPDTVSHRDHHLPGDPIPRVHASAFNTFHYQPDEDALCPLLELLARRQCYQEGLEYYAHFVQSLEEQGLTRDGKPRVPDQRTRDLVDYLRLKERQPIVSRPPQRESTPPSSAGILAQRDGMTVTGQEEMLALFSSAVKQGILQAAGELERDTMDQLRRQMLQHTLGITSAALVTSASAWLHTDMVERLARALSKPSTIDETTLRYLESRTHSYWQDRNSAALASADLLSYVVEHLQKVIVLLEGSLLPTIRTRICSIVGATAMLVGALLYDISYYAEAREFYSAAIKAAQEAMNPGLETVIWGWMSFTWTYEKNHRAALLCIQKARRLAEGSANIMIRAWLAAVEAEIQANLGDFDACLTAFKGTELLEEHPVALEDSYWIHFDRSLLAGYQGICFQRLYRLEDPRTYSFLREAQSALMDALNRLDPTLLRRAPQYHIDLAATYIPQGNIELACNHALAATTIVAQIKAQTVLERLLTLRKELEPWKDTLSVKTVDETMAPLLASEWYRGGKWMK